VPDQPVIPDKVFFRIGEAASITGVKPYVLRFWETEFKTLRPIKSKSGQRRYRRSDIEHVLRIKELLWERKYTIAGARTELRRAKTKPGVRLDEITQADTRGPAAAAASVDPKLTKKIDELEAEARKLKIRLDAADSRAAAAAARAHRSERRVRELAELTDRQRRDLATVRESLVVLRSNVAAYLEEVR
jgi:DNA-binding transcriptional MerR regulator